MYNHYLDHPKLQKKPVVTSNPEFEINPCHPISGVILVCLGQFQTPKKGF
jgi:hypothetical protein